MHKLSALAALALTSAALAYPVKSGYVANGLFRNTAGARPICGPLYGAFRHSLRGAKWAEMYEVKGNRVGKLRLDDFLASIQKSGYRRVRSRVTAQSQVYLFQRRGNFITAVTGTSAGVGYLGLTGQ